VLHFEFLDQIRAQEIAGVVAVLGQPPAQVLEIGAGPGVQAKYLADLGFAVKAIDLAGSQYEPLRVFPVTDYDGRTIPFADNSFDVIFSSHVVMHIVDVAGFNKEVQRVLKPGGRVVHAVPTSAWRFWTFALHYPAVMLNRALAWLDGRALSAAEAVAATRQGAVVDAVQPVARGWKRKLRLPSRIGEHGNVFSEHWLFSDAGWRNVFRRHGWETVAGIPNKIFYTGHMALSSRISLPARRALSHVLGSAGRLYVLRSAKTV
jgi:2-polyprenyl-3-methyl-5-hydroxy-6-metoxy-1,4-benzoquinol methylase